jgi:hypothetical protein
VRRSPAGFPTCLGFAAIEAECSRPYLLISGPIVLYFTAGRQHARGSGRSAPPTGMGGPTESLTSHRSAIGGRV